MKAKYRRNIFVSIVGVVVFAWALTALGCCCPSCESNIYYSPNGRPFPATWGEPPEIQTKDYRPLPHGYGHGSSTLYHWIMENKK